MLNETFSFGGLWKEKKPMQLVQNENVVTVKVVAKQRDRDGRMTYQTVESYDVSGATAEQVAAAVGTFLASKPANPTVAAKK